MSTSEEGRLLKAKFYPALWAQAFRPFFLFGAMFSALAVLLWVVWLNGLITWSPFGGPLFWHQHEMIFGFVGAIVVGFLLTAVQNWTGLRASHGLPLALLFSIWVVARICIALPFLYASTIVPVLSMGFYFMAALFMGRLLWRARNKKNYFFVLMLVVLGLLDLLSQYGISQSSLALQQSSIYAALFLIIQMMMIIGGRVIPMFTASGTATPKVPGIQWLDTSVYVLSFGAIPLMLLASQFPIYNTGAAVCLLLAAAANSIRSVRWYTGAIWTVPLVWTLHVAYLFIPVGQALLAMHFLGFSVSFSAGIHAFAAGAIGNMVLTMMSRVSLGHSGRAITASQIVTVAFLFIGAAAIMRLTSALFPDLPYLPLILLAGGLWAIAYTLFVVAYCNILLSPRADGRPG